MTSASHLHDDNITVTLVCYRSYDGFFFWGTERDLEMMKDAKFMLWAVRENPNCFRLVPPELAQQNPLMYRTLVMMAVEADGMALHWAHPGYRDDVDVVKTAVRSSGTALCFASNRLRGDLGLVSLAVAQTGLALQYASSPLRQNPLLVAAARCRVEDHEAVILPEDVLVTLRAG